jgi:hypothetical protein
MTAFVIESLPVRTILADIRGLGSDVFFAHSGPNAMVAAYLESGGAGQSGVDLKLQTFSPTGDKIGAAITVWNDPTDPYITNNHRVVDLGDRYVVTGSAYSSIGTDLDVFQQVVSKTGVLIGPRTVVSDHSEDWQLNQGLIALSNGNYASFWSEAKGYRADADSFNFKVFDSQGLAISAETVFARNDQSASPNRLMDLATISHWSRAPNMPM